MIDSKDADLPRIVVYWYMVGTKTRARRPFISLSDSCSSGSSPDLSCDLDSGVSNLFWGRMVKESSSSNSVVTRLEVRDPSTGSVLGTPDGLWIDTEYYFVKRDPSINPTFYYRDMSFSYLRRKGKAASELYDKSEVDWAYAGMGISKAP